MNARIMKIAIVSGFAFLCLCGTLHASLPASYIHNTRYIESDGSYSYWTSGTEFQVKDTLPNEWLPSWDQETLKAGAVIIRSGVFWRINRSVLNSGYPNNNCYQGTVQLSDGPFKYYRTSPQTRGGQDQWIPGSRQTATNTATDATANIHADRLTTPAGRPDRFVPHRYGSTVQNNTRNCAGTYVAKIRCAVVGFGGVIDPCQECSQVDDLTNTDPTYTSN